MALGADDGQTAGLLNLGGELDVGASARHIGGDGDSALLAGLSHDVSLLLVELRIQHLMRNLAQLEHS